MSSGYFKRLHEWYALDRRLVDTMPVVVPGPCGLHVPRMRCSWAALQRSCQPSADKIRTAALRPLSRNRTRRGSSRSPAGDAVRSRRTASSAPISGREAARPGCREPRRRRRALCGGKIRGATCGAALSLAGGPPRLFFTLVLLDFGSPSSTPRRPRPQASSVLSPSSQAPQSQDVRSSPRCLCCEFARIHAVERAALISCLARTIIFSSSLLSRTASHRRRRRPPRRPLSGTSRSVATPRPTAAWSSSHRR